MTHDELLAIFDREQRREIEFPNIRREVTTHTVRHVVPPGDPWGAFLSHSRLDESNVDAIIESEIAYFESLGLDFEWKAYDYDTPADLLARLTARGFEVEDPEAVMVLDLEHASTALWQPIAQDVRRLTDPAQLVGIAAIPPGGLGREVRLAGQGVGRRDGGRQRTHPVLHGLRRRRTGLRGVDPLSPRHAIRQPVGRLTLAAYRRAGCTPPCCLSTRKRPAPRLSFPDDRRQPHEPADRGKAWIPITDVCACMQLACET